jgi:hypothetical protein
MRALLAVLVVLLLVGCGPSRVEQRACDLYVEQDGGHDVSVEEWVKTFSDPTWIENNRRRNEKNGLTDIWANKPVQEHAEAQARFVKDRNEKVRALVSSQLSISLREVDEALKKCMDSATKAMNKRKYGT